MKQGVRPLAHQRGFEPPTYRLGGGRSILLSYKRLSESLIILPQNHSAVNEYLLQKVRVCSS